MPRKNGKKKLKPIIPWYGGKQRIAADIIPFFPAHRTYVEVFGGTGAVLLQKEPSPVEVYNDLNGALVNMFRVVRDKPEELDELLKLTLYAKEELEHAHRVVRSGGKGVSDV